MGRIEYRLSMAAGVRSAGRLDESRLPEGTEMFLPDGPSPEVVYDEDEDEGGQRSGNRFPECREAERDDPIEGGSAQEGHDRGPVPSAAVPVVAAFLREEVVRVAPRLDEEVVDERESPQGHDDRSEEVEEENVREDEVRLEEREERERDDDHGGQEEEPPHRRPPPGRDVRDAERGCVDVSRVRGNGREQDDQIRPEAEPELGGLVTRVRNRREVDGAGGRGHQECDRHQGADREEPVLRQGRARERTPRPGFLGSRETAEVADELPRPVVGDEEVEQEREREGVRESASEGPSRERKRERARGPPGPELSEVEGLQHDIRRVCAQGDERDRGDPVQISNRPVTRGREEPLQKADEENRRDEIVIDRGARGGVERIGPAEGQVENERCGDRGDEDIHRGPSVSKEQVEDGGQFAPPQAEGGSEQGHGGRSLDRRDVADEGPLDEREGEDEAAQPEQAGEPVRAGHVAAVQPRRRQRSGGEPESELIPPAKGAGLRWYLVGRLVLGDDDVEAPENLHARDAFRRAI